MLIKIMGAIDVLAGLILIFGMGVGLPVKVILFLGMVLMLKSSLGMLQDFASWVDFLGGITILLSTLIAIPFLILVVLGILLIQKGLFSFI